MRAARFASGRNQAPFAPLSPTNIFARNVSSLALASDQTPALRIANQLNYGNPLYDYQGKKEGPRFYGYTGLGYGSSSARMPRVEIATYTTGVFVVAQGQPTESILYVDAKGEPRKAGESANLQSYFEAVPMPEISKVPASRLSPEIGSDRFLCVYQPSTDRMWEFWNLQGVPGSYTFEYGGFIDAVSESDGILPHNWGAMATSLAMIGGLITMQDLVEVLEGKPIKHAVILYLPATDEGIGAVAPATRTDVPEKTFVAKEVEGKANPAYGLDAVNESRWFRFTPGTVASEFGLTKRLETAIFDAIRDYGVFVGNAAGNVNFYMEWPGVLGSPYSWAKVNPLSEPLFNWGSYPWIPPSWRDSALPSIGEEPSGATGVFAHQPWQSLELLAPRSS